MLKIRPVPPAPAAAAPAQPNAPAWSALFDQVVVISLPG